MATASNVDFNHSPQIVVSSDDHRQLMALAMAGIGNSADDADGLLYELERARVVPDDAVPDDVVRMGSTVRYRTNGGDERSVELTYPKDADIETGKVSVLTPIGTALIGLRQGQSIDWLTRNGRKQVLTVLDVAQPDGTDPGPLAA